MEPTFHQQMVDLIRDKAETRQQHCNKAERYFLKVVFERAALRQHAKTKARDQVIKQRQDKEDRRIRDE